MEKYYGIEVNHGDSNTWFNCGKLYSTKEIAEEALDSIKRSAYPDSSLQGSSWRIFEIISIKEIYKRFRRTRFPKPKDAI